MTKRNKLRNCDGIDWLNNVSTCSFIFLAILFVGYRYYIAQPIKCWTPEEIRNESMEKYVRDYCYVENTYFVATENDTFPSAFPSEVEKQQRYEQDYYFWVPLLLIVSFFLFLLPKQFWNVASFKAGLTPDEMRNYIYVFERYLSLEWQAALIAYLICDNIDSKKCQKIRFFGPLKTCYFTINYLFYKFLNFVNAFGQLLVLNRFLGGSYNFGGFGLLQDLMNGKSWRLTGNFPRITFCDVMVRDDSDLGVPMNFTVQCVLPNNMYNEKLYVILYFWFLILTCLNFVNLSYWIFTSFNKQWKIRFIKDQLDYVNLKYNPDEVSSLIEEWIKTDGITAIRLISITCGGMISSDIVKAMVLTFKRKDFWHFRSIFGNPKFGEPLPPIE